MKNATATLQVDEARICVRLKELSVFGKNAQGGIDRNFGSAADLRARDYLITLLRTEIGAAVHIDAAANIWAGINGSSLLPAIALGSHHDTVLNGGMYDGALGVILAMEVLQVIKENAVPLRHPIALVSFTAEEPNPFNLSTFGSRIVTGRLTPDRIAGAEDKISRLSLSAALERAGGSIADLAAARLSPAALSAFIECHIEQGKRLEKRDMSLAVVSRITGIYRETIRIYGEANHAGTTLMVDRHDALLAAAELCLAFETILKQIHRDDVVGTVGHMEIFPNAVNIIPGETTLTMEIRTPDQAVVTSILTELAKHIGIIEAARGVRMERILLLDQASVTLDETVIAALKRAVQTMAEPCATLTSMAGHDATHLAGITRSGMLFIRSIGGKSHCPEENSRPEDIEKAGNALLKTILLLDKELDSHETYL